jgi:hypothetical protein
MICKIFNFNQDIFSQCLITEKYLEGAIISSLFWVFILFYCILYSLCLPLPCLFFTSCSPCLCSRKTNLVIGKSCKCLASCRKFS